MLLADVFSGCFVFLMFTVLLFFLIYGIEIFCKVQFLRKIAISAWYILCRWIVPALYITTDKIMYFIRLRELSSLGQMLLTGPN